MNRLNVFILITGLLSASVQATTLKYYGQISNALLALADHPDLQNKCHWNAVDISNLSQKLKIKIDQKISNLSDHDFVLIVNRNSICDQQCYCDIDQLALQTRSDFSSSVGVKTIDTQQRKKCFEQLKISCENLKKFILN